MNAHGGPDTEITGPPLKMKRARRNFSVADRNIDTIVSVVLITG